MDRLLTKRYAAINTLPVSAPTTGRLPPPPGVPLDIPLATLVLHVGRCPDGVTDEVWSEYLCEVQTGLATALPWGTTVVVDDTRSECRAWLIGPGPAELERLAVAFAAEAMAKIRSADRELLDTGD